MTHLALLHRARTALQFPGQIDVPALLHDLDKAIEGSYPPKPVRGFCWCGDNAVDGHHCTFHSELQTGDG